MINFKLENELNDFILNKMNRYDVLIIDAVNLAYKIFNKKEEPFRLSKKFVYKESVCNFIRTVEKLEEQYLHSDGSVYLLIDNYFSRMDLESAFLSLNRHQLDEAYKATRKKENREFFNSINFLRYYYIINAPKYHTLRIDELEADDLVKPLVTQFLQDKTCLLVTNDLDWCRYLKTGIDWLPHLSQEPENVEELQVKLNFPITETNLICYKAFFGDDSDNIAALAPENDENKASFISLLSEVKIPNDVIYLSRDVDKIKKYPILNYLTGDYNKKITREQRFLINIHLISTLPCASEYIRRNITTGSNNKTLLKAVREAVGLDTPKSVFVFGNLKRPRV